jgi:hypothetical protein
MGDATFMIEHGPLSTGDVRIIKIRKEDEYHVEFEYFDYSNGEDFWRSEAVFKTRKEAKHFIDKEEFML